FSGCTVATTLAAELSTRKRSCGSGCGSATAELTTFNTNAFRACSFWTAVSAGFSVPGFLAGPFTCATDRLASERASVGKRMNLFISFTVGCNREPKKRWRREPFHISLRPSFGGRDYQYVSFTLSSQTE